jgi:adenylate cyclase
MGSKPLRATRSFERARPVQKVGRAPPSRVSVTDPKSDTLARGFTLRVHTVDGSSPSFGLWLRQRRRALDMTHATLAEVAHCSVSALRKIEQDERRPSRHLAERLAACLRVPANERSAFVEAARGLRPVDRLEAAPLAALPRPAGDTAPRAALGAVLPTFDATMPSIAVLPFVNLSDDAADEHFADGLAEELLNVLAKIPGLRVSSRTSAFTFKGKDVDVPTAARRLNVSTVLEGSIRRAGSRVRVVAQLIHGSTDSHLWSEIYDRSLDDIFAVQDDIAQSVVRELRAVLLGETPDAAASARARAEVLAATSGRTRSARAHEVYLQGRFLVERLTQQDAATGIGYCRQALRLDPEYALAWAGLANAYSTQASFGWAPLVPTFELAREAALRALALQPDLPEGHAELGWVRMIFDWDWTGAAESYRQALTLGAGHPSIVRAAALLADSLERLDEAVVLARRGVELDPLNFIAHGNLALRCLDAGLLDEAAAAVDDALALNPRGALLHWVRGAIRLESGRSDEALASFEAEPLEPLRLLGRTLAQHARGQRKASRETLQQLIGQCSEEGAFQVAEAYAGCGDTDRAFEWLERAYAQRDPGLAQMRSVPFLRRLHSDPRWTSLLRKMKFA